MGWGNDARWERELEQMDRDQERKDQEDKK